MPFHKIEIYVPESHLEAVKDALFAAGAGRLGNYDKCSWQTLGTGQFRPLDGSKPFLGAKGEVEHVKEWKLELICDSTHLDSAIKAMKEAHPYETPAYQTWPANI